MQQFEYKRENDYGFSINRFLSCFYNKNGIACTVRTDVNADIQVIDGNERWLKYDPEYCNSIDDILIVVKI